MSTTIIETTAGRIGGTRSPVVSSFLGIPYGAPVSGEHRFRAPRPAEPWAGVRDASVFGAASPQSDPRASASPAYYEVLRLLYPGVPTPLEGRASAEDCLYLNVWTPAPDAARRGVMVWLHGGGFVHGTGAEGWFNGDRLAAAGDVVVVTINHRLGALGFLGPADGSHAESGLAGMLDIVEALRWVRDNIAAFGGDPGNVTVFGQSGGGGKVATLLAMPGAAGLFHKAVVQSAPSVQATTREDAAAVRSLVERTLTDAGTDLSSAPVAAIVEAQDAVLADRGALGFGPVLHDDLLPRHPFLDGAPAISDGIPVLIGTTTHEFSLMLAGDDGYRTLTDAGSHEAFSRFFPEDTDDVVARYRELEPGDLPQLALARATTDVTFRAASDGIRSAKATQTAPVFAYRLDYRTEVLGGVLGAHHSLDLPFVFGNVDRSPVTGTRPERFAVSDAMVAAWSSFARTGDPGWEAFDAERPAQRVFGGDRDGETELDEPRELPPTTLRLD